MSADCYLSALEVARLVGERALSPVEYVEMLLARIDEHDPRLDTVLQIDREAVLGSARRAEQAVMDGASLGPLHGVPFGLKDIIDAKGLRTTGHSKILADNVAGHDACATAKIQSAGGLMIGKLATHEFALGGPSFDLPWPPARNPWNRDMWPGGSSSGSAAAVAAGFMPLALGTDTGGSVRNPATQCGLVGMMATYGRVSRRGVFPLSFSLDHVGPLTRTVAENAVLLGVISGHDPADPGSAAAPVPDFTSGFGQGIGGVRVGVIRHFFESDMRAHSDVVAGIDAALAVLSDLGAHVEEVRTEPLEAFTDCNRTILLSEGYAVHETWLRSRPEDYGSLARERFLPGAFLRAVDYVQATRRRRELIAAYEAATAKFDVVVTASSMDPPAPIEDAAEMHRCYSRQARSPFNVLGNPAVSLPVGFTSDELPLSMQVAGRPFDEVTVYRVAHAYEEATTWTSRHPPIGT